MVGRLQRREFFAFCVRVDKTFNRKGIATMKRRSFLNLAGATAVGLGFPMMARAQQAKRFDGITLRTNGYGGESTRVFREFVIKPLREETGLNVEIQDGSASGAMTQVLASPNNPPFDFVMGDSPNLPALIKAGLLAPVTVEQIPNIAKIRPSAREFGEFGVPYLTNAVVLTYNEKHVQTPLKSYKDLARPDLRDSIGMLSPENTGGILTLLGLAAAYGATLDNMTPVFDALRAMKGNIASATSSSVSLVQQLEQEEVVAGPIFDGRVNNMRAKGLPMRKVIPDEGIFALYNTLSPLKTSKHLDAVYAYINRVLTDEVLTELMKAYRYAPVTDVPISADVAQEITINAETVNLLKPVDWTKVASMQGALIEQFKKALQ